MLINIISRLGRHVINTFSSTDYNGKLLTQSPHWDEIWHKVGFGVGNTCAYTRAKRQNLFTPRLRGIMQVVFFLFSSAESSSVSRGSTESYSARRQRAWQWRSSEWWSRQLTAWLRRTGIYQVSLLSRNKVEFTFGNRNRYIRAKGQYLTICRKGGIEHI